MVYFAAVQQKSTVIRTEHPLMFKIFICYRNSVLFRQLLRHSKTTT